MAIFTPKMTIYKKCFALLIKEGDNFLPRNAIRQLYHSNFKIELKKMGAAARIRVCLSRP